MHGERGDYTVSRVLPEEISRLHSSTAPLCPLACDICNVCVHTLTCTRLDYQLRNAVCKHIHAVVQLSGIETVVSSFETQDRAHVRNLTEQEEQEVLVTLI